MLCKGNSACSAAQWKGGTVTACWGKQRDVSRLSGRKQACG
jgi:hypothetical protein